MASGYEGWSNYETWSVNLIGITDNDSSQNIWREVARQAWTHHEQNPNWTKSEAARFRLADDLKDHFGRMADVLFGNAKTQSRRLFGQLLTSSLAEVNWDELANDLLITTIGDEYQPAECKHVK